METVELCPHCDSIHKHIITNNNIVKCKTCEKKIVLCSICDNQICDKCKYESKVEE